MVSKAGDGAFGVFDKCRDAVAIPIYLHILTEDEKIQVNLFIRSTFFEKLQTEHIYQPQIAPCDSEP